MTGGRLRVKVWILTKRGKRIHRTIDVNERVWSDMRSTQRDQIVNNALCELALDHLATDTGYELVPSDYD